MKWYSVDRSTDAGNLRNRGLGDAEGQQPTNLGFFAIQFGYFCPTPANVKSAVRGGTSWTETPYTCQGAMSG
jgi:hypothetical protein